MFRMRHIPFFSLVPLPSQKVVFTVAMTCSLTNEGGWDGGWAGCGGETAGKQLVIKQLGLEL